MYLASLRDLYSGRYLHEGWFSLATPQEVHLLLIQLHREIFRNVLELGFVDLCHQIRAHFDSLGCDVRATTETWIELAPYREMIPQGLSVVEREFFISQMQAALSVLVRCPNASVLVELAASPHRRPAPPPRPLLEK